MFWETARHGIGSEDIVIDATHHSTVCNLCTRHSNLELSLESWLAQTPALDCTFGESCHHLQFSHESQTCVSFTIVGDVKKLAKRTAKWFCLWHSVSLEWLSRPSTSYCFCNSWDDHHVPIFAKQFVFQFIACCSPGHSVHWIWYTLRIYHETCHQLTVCGISGWRFMQRAPRSELNHCVSLPWSKVPSVVLVILLLSFKNIVPHFLYGVISFPFKFQSCSKFCLEDLLHAKLSVQGGLLIQMVVNQLASHCLLASFSTCVRYVIHVCVVAGRWSWSIPFVVMENWVSQLNEIVPWQLFVSLQLLGSKIEDILEHETGQIATRGFFTIAVLLIYSGSVVCWGCQRMSWGCFIMHAKGCHNNLFLSSKAVGRWQGFEFACVQIQLWMSLTRHSCRVHW